MAYIHRVLHNKKLFGDINNLEKILDHRDQEIFNLQRQNEDLNNANSRFQSDKIVLEKNVIINLIFSSELRIKSNKS